MPDGPNNVRRPLDPVDRAILHELAVDARMPNNALAERVGVAPSTCLARVRALDALARERGQTLAQMALAWALRDPRVTSVLVGASSVAQLEENVAATMHLGFTDEELAAIDEHAVEAGINLWAASSDG